MMEVLSRCLTTYTLLCLILLQLSCIQTQDETSYAEHDSYSSVNNAIRDISENRITAGNTRCRADHQCVSDGEEHFWCYTDEGRREMCCEGECTNMGSEDFPVMMCPSGTTYAICGSSGDTAADGTKCRSSHPCGFHGQFLNGNYWCYDENNKQKECCDPFGKCPNDV